MVNNEFKPNSKLKHIVDSCLSLTFLRLHSNFCGINILSSKKLKSSDKLVLGLILSFQSQGRPFKMGTRRIAKELGMSKATVARSVKTLLGENKSTNAQLVTSKPIYWQSRNNKKPVNIKGRQLSVNIKLCQKYIESRSNSSSKGKNNTKSKESQNRIWMPQNETPNKSPLNSGVHALSKNRKYTSSQNETGLPQYETGVSQNDVGSLQNKTNNINHHSNNKSTNKSKSSSSSSVPSKEDSVDDDDDFSNSNLNLSNKNVANASQHKLGSKSKDLVASRSANDSELRQSNTLSGFSKEATTALTKSFPKLKKNKNIGHILDNLSHEYSNDAVQKGIEAVITRAGSIHAPIPYLSKIIPKIYQQIVKQSIGKDPNIPNGLTQNQWNMLSWPEKRADIQQMMIRGHRKGGRAYIESFIRRYHLHETDHMNDSHLPYSKIEHLYMYLIHEAEIQDNDGLGAGFEQALSSGSLDAIKKEYYFFTLARLESWLFTAYNIDPNNVINTPHSEVAKEEQKIEDYDKYDLNQLAIDKVAYKYFIKHITLEKRKFERSEMRDKRHHENIKFLHNVFNGKSFPPKEFNIINSWTYIVPNKKFKAILNNQLTKKEINQLSSNDIFKKLKQGMKQQRSLRKK